MSSPTCRLGEYGVALVKRGEKLSTAGAKPTRIEYGRKMDDSARAEVRFVTAGDNCCGQLGSVNHWDTDLVVTAINTELGQDEVMFRGPVLTTTYGKGYATVEAYDVLKWLEHREIETDFNFPSQDVSDIFIALATYSYDKEPQAQFDPRYSIVRYDSGVSEARVVEAASNRMAWNVIQEMLQAGLDVTTVGSRIIVGVPNFATFNLTDKQVAGEVQVVKDGAQFANRVLANASRDIVGVYPPGVPVADANFPLVEAQIVDSQLPDTSSAIAAAKARYDFGGENGVVRVKASGGLQLLPNSNINPRTLIAGQLIRFTATETCYKASEVLRVGSLNVVVEKGSEIATIDLQPIGGVAETV